MAALNENFLPDTVNKLKMNREDVIADLLNTIVRTNLDRGVSLETWQSVVEEYFRQYF
jgi:hypothetical protein